MQVLVPGIVASESSHSSLTVHPYPPKRLQFCPLRLWRWSQFIENCWEHSTWNHFWKLLTSLGKGCEQSSNCNLVSVTCLLGHQLVLPHNKSCTNIPHLVASSWAAPSHAKRAHLPVHLGALLKGTNDRLCALLDHRYDISAESVNL